MLPNIERQVSRASAGAASAGQSWPVKAPGTDRKHAAQSRQLTIGVPREWKHIVGAPGALSAPACTKSRAPNHPCFDTHSAVLLYSKIVIRSTYFNNWIH